MGIVDAKDFEALSPVFRGPAGHRRAEWMMRTFRLEKINQIYDHLNNYAGAEFTARFLDDIGVKYVIGNAERLNQLPEGAFITVSNHPYGMLDGIILIDLVARLRHDYKFMVNTILSGVKTLEENFISVTPTGDEYQGVTSTSLQGIRKTLTWLQEGHAVGFFPSGAVSDFSIRDLRVRDRKWQPSVIHLIRDAKVPIVPVRFFDGNSPFYYFLGLIDWRIRLLRLPSELFNKRKHIPRIGIGNIIPVGEQVKFADDETLGAFLRKKVYEMPKPDSFIAHSVLPG
ncbi:MAG: 1-acyl-sn-glycerol-3-phosphate acyltransferase [Bacteroidales bacterium]|nr:1-acyl-sn-glycerol-3-phosphate acyltransferase [Lentimicrobiaceae bacterium]MDD5695628.1 1-acyl-sn-glycerol-3-phosphate acyltransferase [Bacteroidales bacterium]